MDTDNVFVQDDELSYYSIYGRRWERSGRRYPVILIEGWGEGRAKITVSSPSEIKLMPNNDLRISYGNKTTTIVGGVYADNFIQAVGQVMDALDDLDYTCVINKRAW